MLGNKYGRIKQQDSKQNTFSFRDNQTLVVDKKKYNAVLEHLTGDITLEIFNLTVNDTGNYTIKASNGYFTKSVTYDLKKKGNPFVYW